MPSAHGMTKQKRKEKQRQCPGCGSREHSACDGKPQDPRDVALRVAYRQVNDLRAALRLVFEFYERPRETFGVDDVLRVKAARYMAFGGTAPAPPAREKN